MLVNLVLLILFLQSKLISMTRDETSYRWSPLASWLMCFLFTALSRWSEPRLGSGEGNINLVSRPSLRRGGQGRPGEARGGQGREPLLVTAMIKQVQGTPGLVHTFFLLPSFPFPFHSERIIPFDQSEVRILSWWPIRSSWYSPLRHPWWHGPGSDAFFRISRVSRRGVAAWFAARSEAPDTGHSRVSSRASDWSGPTPRTSTIWRQFLQRTASVNKQLSPHWRWVRVMRGDIVKESPQIPSVQRPSDVSNLHTH